MEKRYIFPNVKNIDIVFITLVGYYYCCISVTIAIADILYLITDCHGMKFGRESEMYRLMLRVFRPNAVECRYFIYIYRISEQRCSG